MKIYGYCRVSTVTQNTDRQLADMLLAGVPEENIFIDKATGRNFTRTGYRRLIRNIRKGDLLYIKSIDRLGRSYGEITEQWRLISKGIGADIVVLDMPLLDTRGGTGGNLMGAFVSDLVLQILSFVANYECDEIKRRQAEGIAAAKRRGVRFGRPFVDAPANFEGLLEKLAAREITESEALTESGLKKSTFYKRARELRGGLPIRLA